MEKLDASISDKIQRHALRKEPSESTQIPSHNAMLGELASPETARRDRLTTKCASLGGYKHDEDRQDCHQKDPAAAMPFDWRHGIWQVTRDAQHYGDYCAEKPARDAANLVLNDIVAHGEAAQLG
jgi:hypothetical protein